MDMQAVMRNRFGELTQKFNETHDDNIKGEIQKCIDTFFLQGKVILHYGFALNKYAKRMEKKWHTLVQVPMNVPANDQRSTSGGVVQPRPGHVTSFPSSDHIKVELFSKGISKGIYVKLLQKGDDGSSLKLSPAVETEFFPGKKGAKDDTFVLYPGKRTVRILRKAYRLLYERKQEAFFIYTSAHPELQLDRYRRYFPEHESRHFYTNSAATAKPTSTLLDVRKYRQGESYAESVDATLVLARHLDDGGIQYREVVTGTILSDHRLSMEQDIVLWEHETSLALLYDWTTMLTVVMKKKGQIQSRINAPAERPGDNMEDEDDGDDEADEEMGTLMNEARLDLAEPAAKKRRRGSEDEKEVQ
ncbi:hypothetical protein F4779DRAFT_577552 [Xylariaceae sp. FL0662B]|nr:hypothetical protein F4779DRAFT_577552 [Xylariaceae sp. FL0662B]